MSPKASVRYAEVHRISTALLDARRQRFTDAALAVSDDCIKIIGLDGSLQYMTEGGRRVMEIDDFESMKGCPWPDFWQDQGHSDAVAAIEAARLGQAARFTGFADTAKGNRRFWDVKVSPIFDDEGNVESILSVSRDITDLRKFEEEQALLRSELSHRIKNVFALVQAIANQTLKADDALSSARPAFLARLASLGRAHDLLTRTSAAKSSMRAVIETTVADFPGRIEIDGPEIAVSARSGLGLALTFHELATNALKYGAWSDADGTVSIQWTVRPVEGQRWVELNWVESGGPKVEPPQRTGFGSQMINRALTGYVDGISRIEFGPAGVHFTLQAPVDALRAD